MITLRTTVVFEDSLFWMNVEYVQMLIQRFMFTYQIQTSDNVLLTVKRTKSF